ncbi:MAG: PLP-dependent aminotransferase family protein [Bdellovibrionota bacterium]|jgi:2-aminoadipate transaminase
MQRHPLAATRTEMMNPSAVREILKSLSTLGMIAFAAGAPDPESFPLKIIDTLITSILQKQGAEVLKYGITEGYPPLREALAKYVAARGILCTAADVCISTGAQGAIDAATKILTNKGDTIAVEAPTYLSAINTFKCYEANILGMASDDHGLMPSELEKAFSDHNAKFAYVIPNFQNPSGKTLSLQRRQEIAEILKKYDRLLIEDDPYYELRYFGEHLPTIKSLAPDHVIYLGSFSKILSPGMRIGYYIAPRTVADLMTTSRQMVDVHANLLCQAVAAEYINGGYLEKHLPFIINLYKPKLQAIKDSLKEFMPKDFSWSDPLGGMFIWVTGPQSFDAADLAQKALIQKVAVVPGSSFFSNPSDGTNTMRLNFTSLSEEQIRQGIKVLGDLLK